MRKFTVPLVLLLVLQSQAQQTRTVDVNNDQVQVIGNHFYFVGSEPVSATKYIRVVQGSPYFDENWMKGKVMMEHGTIYDGLRLRLDLLGQQLQYISPDGKEMTASTPVKMVFLTDSVTGKEYSFEHSTFIEAAKPVENGWYQVLATGSASCYKRLNKKITEMRPYGSATVEQSIYTTPQYYVMVDSVMYAVKKFKDLPGILSLKKDELTAYIKSRGLNGRSDADYSDLVSYYNDLVAK